MEITNLNLQSLIENGLRKGLEFLNIYKVDIFALTSAIMLCLFAISIVTIVLWLLKSVGLYTMAKKNRDEYAFLAFIPYASLYTKGKIVGKTRLFGIDIDHPEFLLLILLVTMFFPATKLICSILFIFFYFAILYKIYQKQIPNFAIAALLLTIFLPFLEPFFLFFIRKNKGSTLIKE